MKSKKGPVQGHGMFAGLFFLGLLFAASDGKWFPIVNLVGLCLVALSAIAAKERPSRPEREMIRPLEVESEHSHPMEAF